MNKHRAFSGASNSIPLSDLLVLWMNNSLIFPGTICLLGKVTHSSCPVLLSVGTCTCHETGLLVQMHFGIRQTLSYSLYHLWLWVHWLLLRPACWCVPILIGCGRCYICIMHGCTNMVPVECLLTCTVCASLLPCGCMVVCLIIGDCQSCRRSIYVQFMHNQFRGVVVSPLLLWQAKSS